MNISYPMIAHACSQNDRLSETRGIDAAIQDLDMGAELVKDTAQQAAVVAYFAYFRQRNPPKKRFVPDAKKPIRSDERTVNEIFERTWKVAFKAGMRIEDPDKRHDVEQDGLETAAEQRALRMINHLRGQAPMGEGLFSFREGPLVISEMRAFSFVFACWMDGFVAGVRATQKAIKVTGGTT